MIKLLDITGKNVDLEFGRYPDGTTFLKANEFLTKDVTRYMAKVMTMTKPSVEEIYTFMSLWKSIALHNRAVSDTGSPDKTKLFLPMIPMGRQDKRIIKLGVDFLSSGEFFANLLNSFVSNSYHLYTVDPHSDFVVKEITKQRTVKIIDIVKALGLSIMSLQNRVYDCVICPDSGALNRAKLMADALEIPMLMLRKHRDMDTGYISHYSSFDIGTTKALVVDDICDGGATFNMLAKSGNPEASLDLFVTFGIFSKGLSELEKNFDNIYTTDLAGYEIPNGVRVINILDRLIQEIANDTV